MPSESPPFENSSVAGDRFDRRAQSIATLLAHRLESTISLHDLTRKRLWATHRNIADLRRQGRAPTLSDFWEQTAHRQARHFLTEAVNVIDAEREELTKALQHYAISIAEQDRGTADGGPEAASATVERNMATAMAGIELVVGAATAISSINELGAWWQGRLRRAAIMATAGRLLFTPVGRFELEVSAAEMRLLDRPPWSHDDRMLSAFELAHSDLRDHLASARNELGRQARAMITQVHAGDATRRVDRYASARSVQPEQSASIEAIELH